MIDSPQERWSQLRVLVDRGSTGHAYATVILRTVDGRFRRDQRIRTVRLDLPDGGLESMSWWHALAAAVEGLATGEDYV
jgi:hypothetical protein